MQDVGLNVDLLKKIRESGLTMNYIAHRLGLTYSALYHSLYGYNRSLTSDRIKEIMEVLNGRR